MATVGEILRRERERQGLTLSMIADQTRIRKQFLEALETDQYSELPGKFFVRAFAVQYAERLGMDTGELNVALQRTFSDVEVPAFGTAEVRMEGAFPERPAVAPLPEGTASALGAKRVAASAVMMVAVAVVCGLFFWLWQRSEISSTSAGAVSTPMRPGMTEPVAGVTVSPPAAQPAVKAAEPAPGEQPAQQTAVAAASAQDPGKINLVLTASANVWVRVTADNRVVMEKLMVNGDSESAAANDNARILMGNAGALGIRFNGSDLGALGQLGQVKTVDFTPNKYQVLEPPRPASEPPAQEPTTTAQAPPQPGS